MRILLTNIGLCDGSGTETLTRDLSQALRRRGHTVICFAPTLGRIAAEIRATGTPVVQSLMAVAESPDIIHGHHSGPTMMALARFREARAVFVCHDWSSVYDDPPLHPRIGRYLYVRNVLRERLVSEKNIPSERVKFWGNTIDLIRVAKSKSPPQRPRTAGVYSHIGAIPFLDVLARGCSARGIAFLGELLHEYDQSQPVEDSLSPCDIVFASGRMAIEAIAAGCAVVNVDRFGIGGLVTGARLSEFRAANFAIGALSAPTSETALIQALDLYDSADVARVTMLVRHDCDIEMGTERLEQIYLEMLDEQIDRADEDLAFARYLEENFQRGRLYHGEFARRILAPTPADELQAVVRKLDKKVEDLSVALDELSYQWSLSRSFLTVISRKVYDRWRNRRSRVPAYLQRDAGANVSSNSINLRVERSTNSMVSRLAAWRIFRS
jgi:glycosyl transferase family 4